MSTGDPSSSWDWPVLIDNEAYELGIELLERIVSRLTKLIDP